jgi:hypothetical protein
MINQLIFQLLGQEIRGLSVEAIKDMYLQQLEEEDKADLETQTSIIHLLHYNKIYNKVQYRL